MAESPLTVLIVDDEENHADVIAVSLEKLGVVCQVAYSQVDALKKINEKYFDVIITDLMLERPDVIVPGTESRTDKKIADGCAWSYDCDSAVV